MVATMVGMIRACPKCGGVSGGRFCSNCNTRNPELFQVKLHHILIGFAGLIAFYGLVAGVKTMTYESDSSPARSWKQADDRPIAHPTPPVVTTPSVQDFEDQRALDLTITHPHWSKSEFGVATWEFKVHNSSKLNTWKDIHFKTYYWAPSGTLIDQSWIGQTQYVLVPPGKTVTIHFSEFTQSQATKAHIEIDKAVLDGWSNPQS
jgi:hypothetical protein